MVSSVTGLGRNGLQDWILQRISAVILLGYLFGLAIFFLYHGENISFTIWKELFDYGCMKLATFLALLSLIVHAWIGMWTVVTDYLKPVWIKLPMQLLINTALILYLVWGGWILWS